MVSFLLTSQVAEADKMYAPHYHNVADASHKPDQWTEILPDREYEGTSQYADNQK